MTHYKKFNQEKISKVKVAGSHKSNKILNKNNYHKNLLIIVKINLIIQVLLKNNYPTNLLKINKAINKKSNF